MMRAVAMLGRAWTTAAVRSGAREKMRARQAKTKSTLSWMTCGSTIQIRKTSEQRTSEETSGVFVHVAHNMSGRAMGGVRGGEHEVEERKRRKRRRREGEERKKSRR